MAELQPTETHFHGQFDEAARALLAAAGVRPHPVAAGQLPSAAAAAGADLFMLDTHSPDLLRAAVASHTGGMPLVVIDDLAPADVAYPPGAIVLNGTFRGRRLIHRGEGVTRLIGPDHLLVRRRIRATARRARPAAAAKVLVALGGVVDDSLLAGVLRCLGERAGIDVRVAGAGHPPQPAPMGERPAAGELAAHLEWADACVTTGGLTKYEAALLGIPNMTIARTVLEEEDTQLFADAGLTVYLGPRANASDAALREGLARLLDGGERWRGLPARAAAQFGRDPTRKAAVGVLRAAGLAADCRP